MRSRARLRQGRLTATGSLPADCLARADDSWFLFGVPVFSDSPAEVGRNHRKCYCVDWRPALRNSQVRDGSCSRAFENMVHLHLRRSFPRVNYYLTRSRRREVDFVGVDSSGRPAIAVQGCMKLGDAGVMEREIPSLAATARYFGIRNVLVVTSEEDRTIEADGVAVRVAPAWRWMLE